MREEFIEIPVFEKNAPFSISLAGTSYCDGSYYVARENPPHFVIEYIIKGEGTIVYKNKILRAVAGDTYILTVGDKHKYFSDAENPWEKIWINVHGELALSIAQAYLKGNQVVYHCNCESYIRKIHAILGDKNLSVSEIGAKSALVFHELIQHLAESADKKKKTSPEAEIIKSYIDRNIYKTINTDELAKLIYKSPAHTIRIFKNAYGITPYDYYMENRIKKALTLLKETTFFDKTNRIYSEF